MVKQILNKTTPNLSWTSIKVALIYLIVGSLWIVSSDYLLYLMVGTTRSLPVLQTFKGWFYIAVTSFLLYVLVYHYLSKIRLSQESLRRQELNYKDLADSITDIFYALDKNFRFVYWNKASERFSGTSAREVLGKLLTDVFLDTAHRTLETKAREVLQTGHAATFVEAHDRNGRRYFFEVSIYPGSEGISIILKDITERKQAEEELHATVRSMELLIDSTINALASIAERRDPSVPVHQKRVSRLAAAIGAQMGLAHDRIESLRVAGLLHDIGKIAVPAEILSRPGPLSASEFNIVKTYPQVSYEILKPIKFPWPVAEIVLQHQERLNGSGYPRGLKDDQIMLEARILRVADSFEAMSSHRPYRETFGTDQALEDIKRERGIFYDPAVVDTVLRLYRNRESALLMT